MSVYKKDAFDSLIWNPFGQDPEWIDALLTQGQFDVYLKGIRDAEPAKYRGNMVAYIFFMYDIKSKLREWEPNVVARKRKAADLAQFDLDNKHHQKAVEKMFKLEDDGFRKSVLHFIRYQNSKEWALLVTNEQFLWEIQQSIMEQSTNYKDHKQKLDAVKTKSHLAQEADKVIQTIHRYEAMLFQDDDDLKKAAEQIKGNQTSPEAISTLLLKTPEEVDELNH